MQRCANCGCRLPWLHRVVGRVRYCSKECASLHQALLKGAVLSRVEGALDREHPAAGRDEETDAAVLHEELENAPAAGTQGELAPLPCELGPEPEPPNAEAAPPAAMEIPLELAVLHTEDPAAETSQECGLPVIGAPDGPGMQDTLFALPATPVFAAPAVRAAAHALRPRRRVIVPSHRVLRRAALRLTGSAIVAWPAPAASPPRSKSVLPVIPGARQQTLSDPEPVVVFSFMEGQAAGGVSGAGARPGRRPAEWIRQASQEVPVPVLFLRAETLACWPQFATGLRPVRGGMLPVAPQDRMPSLPSGGRRFAPSGFSELWDQQAMATQPFRLHRMPLRPLRLRTVRNGDVSRTSSPPPGRLSFVAALYLPRPVMTPVRPVYAWAAPPSSRAGAEPPAEAQPVGLPPSIATKPAAKKDDPR